VGLISGVSAEENSARDMRLKCVEASTHRVTKTQKLELSYFFQQQAVSSAVSTHPEMTSLPKFTCKIPSACLSESSQACKYQHGLQSYTSCHGGSFGFVKDICLQTTDRTKTPVDP
jgi:hypothetical protein